MHTFYGPRSIHPSTSYDDLRATPPDLSTTPYEENQSLYWHPSIYRVVNGEYILVRNLDSSPYYRWDLSVDPVAEPFPPGFRMIAASDDPVSIKTCSFLHKSRIHISSLCHGSNVCAREPMDAAQTGTAAATLFTPCSQSVACYATALRHARHGSSHR